MVPTTLRLEFSSSSGALIPENRQLLGAPATSSLSQQRLMDGFLQKKFGQTTRSQNKPEGLFATEDLDYVDN